MSIKGRDHISGAFKCFSLTHTINDRDHTSWALSSFLVIQNKGIETISAWRGLESYPWYRTLATKAILVRRLTFTTFSLIQTIRYEEHISRATRGFPWYSRTIRDTDHTSSALRNISLIQTIEDGDHTRGALSSFSLTQTIGDRPC